MQTFLPYAGFDRTARALDPRRLGKQRVEALQVLRGQLVPNYGWRHHPAVKIWLGHQKALAAYGVTICRSHRSALVRKDPAWYGPMFPGVPDVLPYVWPDP